MKVKKTETKKEFRLILGYVDHTYWDDGNRFTSHTLKFNTEGELRAYLKKVEETKSFVLGATTFSIHWLQVERSVTRISCINFD